VQRVHALFARGLSRDHILRHRNSSHCGKLGASASTGMKLLGSQSPKVQAISAHAEWTSIVAATMRLGGVPETTSSCKSLRLMCPPVHFVKLVRMSAIFWRVSPEGNGNFRNVSPVSLSCSMKVCRPVLVPVL
jgi:hypothetical protein